MESLKGKLTEFNSKAPESLQLSDSQLDNLLSLGEWFLPSFIFFRQQQRRPYCFPKSGK